MRMRMEKINDREVRCMVTAGDLQARKITMQELRYGSPATQELFREMVVRASETYGFNAEQLPLMIEAIPMSPDELMVIISVVEDAEELDPHFAHFTELKEEPVRQSEKLFDPDALAEQLRICVLSFDELDEVIRFCRHVGGLFPGKSYLYRRSSGSGFYLVILRPEGMPGREFNVFLNSVLEYGDPVQGSSLLYASLKEHEEPVMEDPLLRLYQL